MVNKVESEKINLIKVLQMLSSPEIQRDYHNTVPIASVPDELIGQWFDDFFFPENKEFKGLFSEQEWGVLLEFHSFFKSKLDLLSRGFEEMEEDEAWQAITAKATWALKRLGWNDLEVSYDE